MINPKDWKDLQDDITTDSLWISSPLTNNRPMFLMPKRDWNLKNDQDFHGLFIPEIPYQFIRRFLPEDGIVWDPFAGSGTTYRVAKYLNLLDEQIVCTDLTPLADYIKQGDAISYKLKQKADLVIAHPPYMNVVHYSDDIRDACNISDIDAFLGWLRQVAYNIWENTNDNAYVILVLGNIYMDGEEKTLGVWGKDMFCEVGFKCKSHIIKDYGETKGNSGKNYNLNYFRQLKGGYNNFYGDNIFILKKSVKHSKNSK